MLLAAEKKRKGILCGILFHNFIDLGNERAGHIEHFGSRVLFCEGFELFLDRAGYAMGTNDKNGIIGCGFQDLVDFVFFDDGNAVLSETLVDVRVMNERADGIDLCIAAFFYERENGIDGAFHTKAEACVFCGFDVSHASSPFSSQMRVKMVFAASLYSAMPPFSKPSSSYLMGLPMMTVTFRNRRTRCFSVLM